MNTNPSVKIYGLHKSNVDDVLKYTFQVDDNGPLHGRIFEISYINNGTGKDILCVPTQFGCTIGCKFCHITPMNDKLINDAVSYRYIVDGINMIIGDYKMFSNQDTLLISFMGVGEPTLSHVYENVIQVMHFIYGMYSAEASVRFGIATSLPRDGFEGYMKIVNTVAEFKYNVKVHLSLHYTDDETRSKWMPNSIDVARSLHLLDTFYIFTGNPIEIHYALIEGVNDKPSDIVRLSCLLKRHHNVKFLQYSQTVHDKLKPSSKYEEFKKHLDTAGIKNEFYVPPGLDVGASCGQFNKDAYLKYNKR